MRNAIENLLLIGGAILAAGWLYSRIYQPPASSYIDCGRGVRVPRGATCPLLRLEGNP